jgi:hypothetical protein
MDSTQMAVPFSLDTAHHLCNYFFARFMFAVQQGRLYLCGDVQCLVSYVQLNIGDPKYSED